MKNKKDSPTPGIEPGPPGWKPGILAIRPCGMVKDDEFNTAIYFWIKCYSVLENYLLQFLSKHTKHKYIYIASNY